MFTQEFFDHGWQRAGGKLRCWIAPALVDIARAWCHLRTEVEWNYLSFCSHHGLPLRSSTRV